MLVVMQREDGTGVTFDAVLQRTQTVNTTVTKFPVETGATISDHGNTDAPALSINGIVGAAPLHVGEGQPGGPDRVQRAFDAIMRMQSDVAPLKVITPERTYANMLITSTSVAKDAATGDALGITIGLQQILTATSAEVRLPVAKVPRNNKTKVDSRKTGTPAVPPPNVSFARQAAQGLARLAGGDAGFAALEGIAKGGA